MEYWGLSDTGKVRTMNQDTFRIEELDRNTVLAAVCDGMGGAKSGNIASRLAIDVFTDEVLRSYKPGMTQEQTEQLLKNALKLANFTVYDQARQFEEFAGMGTTLVAALLCGKTATIINVGDSRCYHITRSDIRRITVDHSLVQLMVDRGSLPTRRPGSIPDETTSPGPWAPSRPWKVTFSPSAWSGAMRCCSAPTACTTRWATRRFSLRWSTA